MNALIVAEKNAVRVWRGRWWGDGQPGPLLQRLVDELPTIGDGALWRLPLWVTGCKSIGQLDKDGWDYENVKARVVGVLKYAKAEQAKERNHYQHHVKWGVVHELPAKV